MIQYLSKTFFDNDNFNLIHFVQLEIVKNIQHSKINYLKRIEINFFLKGKLQFFFILFQVQQGGKSKGSLKKLVDNWFC